MYRLHMQGSAQAIERELWYDSLCIGNNRELLTAAPQHALLHEIQVSCHERQFSPLLHPCMQAACLPGRVRLSRDLSLSLSLSPLHVIIMLPRGCRQHVDVKQSKLSRHLRMHAVRAWGLFACILASCAILRKCKSTTSMALKLCSAASEAVKRVGNLADCVLVAADGSSYEVSKAVVAMHSNVLGCASNTALRMLHLPSLQLIWAAASMQDMRPVAVLDMQHGKPASALVADSSMRMYNGQD
jgi:hypothetical protein